MHILSSAASHPTDIVSGVSESQNVEFFNKTLAERIVSEHGQADAYIAANVMCHIPHINSIVEGIKVLLKPDGIVMFEDPYLGNVVEKNTYDQIYDEHTFLFSVHSIQYLFITRV